MTVHSIPAATLEVSVGYAMEQFGALLEQMIGDATAIFRTVYGIQDGHNYGRYFAGQNPLVPYLPSAVSVSQMLAQGVGQRETATQAVDAAIELASGVSADFANAVFAAVEAMRQACAAPADAVRLATDLTSFTVSAPSRPGPVDAMGVMIVNLVANAAVLMRRSAAVSLGRATATYLPTSQQDASSVRDTAGDAIDEVALEAADRFEDQSSEALDTIRISLIDDMNMRGGSLAPVVTRTFGATQPDLVIAYRLYQDAGRAGDLLARNDPPHPAFMPPTIEALAA